METSKLTLDRLKEAVSYDPATGEFLWVQRGRGIRTGSRAGSTDKGYRLIVIDGVGHYAQRLAWFWVNGFWPSVIRFKNGNKLDCRIDNLRDGFYLTTKHDCKTKEGRASAQLEYRASKREEFVHKERERKFGVSRQKYAELFHAQDGCCAICKQPETATRNGKVKTLAVDHCHETGVVRGLLCVACNTGIGKFMDDRVRLLSAVRYLDKHQGREHAVPVLSVVNSEALV